jgi:hypothetical protein
MDEQSNTPTAWTPTENSSVYYRARGNLAFLLSAIRCGDQLSTDEEAGIRKTIAALEAAERDAESGKYFFPLVGRPVCKTCGGVEGVRLSVGEGGYAVTSEFEHKPECPALRCPHGVPWRDDCTKCNEAIVDEDGDEE